MNDQVSPQGHSLLHKVKLSAVKSLFLLFGSDLHDKRNNLMVSSGSFQVLFVFYHSNQTLALE